MKYLFFHGGPGLNSNPEAHILGQYFSDNNLDIQFWNEPSRQRHDQLLTEDPWENALLFAEKFFLEAAKNDDNVLIGHCLGFSYTYHLAKKFPSKIKGLILISPALAVHRADYNMFKLSMEDFTVLQDEERAGILRNGLEQLSVDYSPLRQKMLACAAENPNLFVHYFSNEKSMENYFAFLVGDYQLDVQNFFEIRRSYRDQYPEEIPVRTRIIFGSDDRIVSLDKERQHFSEFFQQYSIEEIHGAGHFAHLEKPYVFIRSVLDFARQMQAGS